MIAIDWVSAFCKQHKSVLKFCGTFGLDPKCAQAFNPMLIADNFQQLGDALETHKYKIHNIYNFDESMQMGSGRKRTGKKYFVR